MAQSKQGAGISVTAQTTRAVLERRIETLRKEVYDPEARFSRSQMLSELRALETAADRLGGAADSLRTILLMIGLIESKGGETRNVIDAFTRALAIEGTAPLSAERLARTHHMLASHLQDQKQFERAAEHYREAVRFMAEAKHPDFTEDARLGTGQDLGYVLHEAGQFQQALDNNLAVLAGGERLHGADNTLLRSVITNIAQNLHALGRKPEAEPYLKRALGMARAEGKVWNEQNLLFQLGVLAFETGRDDAARRYMSERVSLIRKHGREELLKDALEDQKILEEKIRSRADR